MPETEGARPELSVVIAIVSDTTRPASAEHLDDCLTALSDQADDASVELLVVHPDAVAGLDTVKARFPRVCFVEVAGVRSPSVQGREHHDVLRAWGLRSARGRIVALMEDHATPGPGYCSNVVAAHTGKAGVIGGAIENGVDRPLNWAVYFCDFSRYQNHLPSGESPFASDANVSYLRSALFSVEPVWEESFREVIVNEALRAQGNSVVLDPRIVVFQNRSALRLPEALEERFIWGRSYAWTRSTVLSTRKRVALALLTPVLPVLLTVRAGRIAQQRRRLFKVFLRSVHLTFLLQIVWSVGECVGYLRGGSR